MNCVIIIAILIIIIIAICCTKYCSKMKEKFNNVSNELETITSKVKDLSNVFKN